MHNWSNAEGVKTLQKISFALQFFSAIYIYMCDLKYFRLKYL